MSHHYEEDPLFADEVYFEDEYEEDYEDWYEDHYMGGGWDVHKAQNGQLYAVETTLWRGDFGDDAISGTSQSYSLHELTAAGRAACIRIGKNLKPGKSKEVTITDEDQEEESCPGCMFPYSDCRCIHEDEDLCPVCHCRKCQCDDVGYIPF